MLSSLLDNTDVLQLLLKFLPETARLAAFVQSRSIVSGDSLCVLYPPTMLPCLAQWKRAVPAAAPSRLRLPVKLFVGTEEPDM